MWRWLDVFRHDGRSTDDQAQPETTFVRTLSARISLPEKAGPVMEAVDAFVRLDAATRRADLPRIYLLLEQYLTEIDPIRTLSRPELRANVRTAFPDVVALEQMQPIFDPFERQQLLLCRLFLVDVLDRARYVLGGASLANARSWIAQAPAVPAGRAPLGLTSDPPTTDAEWIYTLTELARRLFEQLRVGLGAATAGIYDAAYAALAHPYAGLETFPAVIRLLPDGLLDEQRIQSLARHGTMARVQSELSAAQRSALDSAQQLQAVLSTVGEGIVTIDADGLLVLVNPEAERTFGYRRDELIGLPLDRLVSIDQPSADDARASLLQKPPGTKTGRLDVHLSTWIDAVGHRRDGSTFPVEVCINETLISDQTFYTAAVRDVTLQRRYERELVEAKEHAEEMTNLKTAFLANMSHEVRTPISGIIGAMHILDEEITEEMQEFTRMAHDSANRLLYTLDAVLEFARLEAGQHEIEFEAVNVESLLDEVGARCARRAREKGLTMSVTASPVAVTADTHALRRTLEVLLENAIRFTEHGSVTVTVRPDDGRIRIAVRDDGIGISPSFLPYIFDEFRQESMGHARTHEGTGLGLAIARRHVHAMHGEIEVESTPGHGSTFTIMLDAADVDAAIYQGPRGHRGLAV